LYATKINQSHIADSNTYSCFTCFEEQIYGKIWRKTAYATPPPQDESATSGDNSGIRSDAFISELETGKRKPSLELVLKFAELFSVTPNHLLLDNLELDQ